MPTKKEPEYGIPPRPSGYLRIFAPPSGQDASPRSTSLRPAQRIIAWMSRGSASIRCANKAAGRVSPDTPALTPATALIRNVLIPAQPACAQLRYNAFLRPIRTVPWVRPIPESTTDKAARGFVVPARSQGCKRHHKDAPTPLPRPAKAPYVKKTNRKQAHSMTSPVLSRYRYSTVRLMANAGPRGNILHGN